MLNQIFVSVITLLVFRIQKILVITDCLYRQPINLNDLCFKPSIDQIIAQKQRFCCFVVSNDSCKRRNAFFKKLSQYKKVDSGGRFLNNIGGPVTNKIDFIKQYKFVICFENYQAPGYVTEKTIEPMQVNSIPIYWEDPFIDRDFNPNSFINISNFKNDEEAIKYIIKVDQDEALYRSYITEPYFHNNVINPGYTVEHILNWLTKRIDNRDHIRLASGNNIILLEHWNDRIKKKS